MGQADQSLNVGLNILVFDRNKQISINQLRELIIHLWGRAADHWINFGNYGFKILCGKILFNHWQPFPCSQTCMFLVHNLFLQSQSLRKGDLISLLILINIYKLTSI